MSPGIAGILQGLYKDLIGVVEPSVMALRFSEATGAPQGDKKSLVLKAGHQGIWLRGWGWEIMLNLGIQVWGSALLWL